MDLSKLRLLTGVSAIRGLGAYLLDFLFSSKATGSPALFPVPGQWAKAVSPSA